MSLKDIIKKFPKTALATILGTVGLGGGVAGANIDDILQVFSNHKHADLQSQIVALEARIEEFQTTQTIPPITNSLPIDPQGYEKALLDIKNHIDSKVLYTCTGEAQ